jgi:aryl-alcohol dehydrogenase-like predicted oxidoreductase
MAHDASPAFSHRFKDNFPQILRAVEDFKEIGSKRGVTASQVALAWVLAQGDDFIPIPGTTKIKVSFSRLTHKDGPLFVL